MLVRVVFRIIGKQSKNTDIRGLYRYPWAWKVIADWDPFLDPDHA